MEMRKTLEERFAPSNYLNQIGIKIVEVQAQWQSDIQNFKKQFVEGALKGAQNEIQKVFELQLKEDAANCL